MTTVVDFPERHVVADEAARWLVRLDADNPPTTEELEMLGEWLRRSPAHREELESLATLWGRMNVLTELAVPLSRPSQADSLSHPGRSATRMLHRWKRMGALTAFVALVIALGFASFSPGPKSDSLRQANGLYATAVGQQKTTTLPDGSQVLLNTNSQIRVDYGEDYRQIHLLQGEALFTVAKDAVHPFRVYAGSGRIQAVGTAFSVLVDGADVRVTVTEGRVSLASVEPLDAQAAKSRAMSSRRSGGVVPGESAGDELAIPRGMVSAGQVATIEGPKDPVSTADEASTTSVTPIAPQELAKRLAWKDGSLMFSGDTLEEVVTEVSRYTTTSIEIADPALRQIRIGGRFPVGEIDVMLAALESNFNVRVTRLGHNRVVLTAADE